MGWVCCFMTHSRWIGPCLARTLVGRQRRHDITPLFAAAGPPSLTVLAFPVRFCILRQ
jgi:hypothetical protein